MEQIPNTAISQDSKLSHLLKNKNGHTRQTSQKHDGNIYYKYDMDMDFTKKINNHQIHTSTQIQRFSTHSSMIIEDQAHELFKFAQALTDACLIT